MTGSAQSAPAPGNRPGPLTPIDAASGKVAEVADRLFTAVAVGEYLPGARFPTERELATQLLVSRATVREALTRLAEAGVIETRRGRGGGSFVRASTGLGAAVAVQRSLEGRWDEIVDAIEAVSRLQETIVRAASENRTPQDLEMLRARLATFASADSGRAKQQADEALHLGICLAAHNRTLTAMLIDLERKISIVGPGHLWGGVEDQEPMEAQALADHEELVRLIGEGDVERSGALARKHAHIDLDLLKSARRRAIMEAENAHISSTP